MLESTEIFDKEIAERERFSSKEFEEAQIRNQDQLRELKALYDKEAFKNEERITEEKERSRTFIYEL